jgi:hypothetical protein
MLKPPTLVPSQQPVRALVGCVEEGKLLPWLTSPRMNLGSSIHRLRGLTAYVQDRSRSKKGVFAFHTGRALGWKPRLIFPGLQLRTSQMASWILANHRPLPNVPMHRWLRSWNDRGRSRREVAKERSRKCPLARGVYLLANRPTLFFIIRAVL